ncbi:MAG: addiction module protein [Myxococcales bacterium]|nr:addiction module protein [Myxococcales bacterium]
MPDHDDIVESVLALPEQQRAEVVREILDSFEEQTTAVVEKAWAEEVARRIRDLTNGAVSSVRWPRRD